MTNPLELGLAVLATLTAQASSLGTAAPAPGLGVRGDEGTSAAAEAELPEPMSLTVLFEVVFYDMYAGPVDEPVPDGAVRLSNTLYAARLSGYDLAKIQNTLSMRVWLGALCDNYDRLAGVFLSLVPKGSRTYSPGEVTRLEIARFITPFMDMNRHHDPVPFDFELNDLVPLLKDEELRAEYDIWLELNVEGVPYAAQKEIAGCAGRNDVFLGTLDLESDSSAPAAEFDFVIPVATRAPLNNYRGDASDEVGTTRKTLEFTLEADTEATQLVLITSNHGANASGEEYSRRDHFVYVDGEEVHAYKPGRESCEPFRAYNSQGNGIYGAMPRSDEEWQSFSNWCPGDVIDTRVIELGPMKAGRHEFVIDVPDAEFVDGQGNIPLSLYVQGR